MRRSFLNKCFNLSVVCGLLLLGLPACSWENARAKLMELRLVQGVLYLFNAADETQLVKDNKKPLPKRCCWCKERIDKQNILSPAYTSDDCSKRESLGNLIACRSVEVEEGSCDLIKVTLNGAEKKCSFRTLHYTEGGERKTISPPQEESSPCGVGGTEHLERSEHGEGGNGEESGASISESYVATSQPKVAYCTCMDAGAGSCQYVLLGVHGEIQSVLGTEKKKNELDSCSNRRVCEDLFDNEKYNATDASTCRVYYYPG